MKNYHHIAVASYTEVDGSKRVGIFAASKPFSKGGKLELVCACIGWNTPTLTDAKHILNGSSFFRATATQLLFNAVDFGKRSAELAVDAPEDFDGLEGAIVAHRVNVTDTCNDNDRAMFEGAALAAFDARILELTGKTVLEAVNVRGLLAQRLAETIGRDAGRALVSLINAYPVQTADINKELRAEQEGPKEEAWNYTSGGALKAAQHAIDCALEQTPGIIEGCRLTLDYPSAEAGYTFIMWAEVNGKAHRNTLAASVTDVARLSMHWAGFVDNVRAARKAVAGAALACASFGPSDMAAVNASAAAAPVEQDRYMFIADQYGIDVCPAMDAAIDEVHEALQNVGVSYDTGITLSYLAL